MRNIKIVCTNTCSRGRRQYINFFSGIFPHLKLYGTVQGAIEDCNIYDYPKQSHFGQHHETIYHFIC